MTTKKGSGDAGDGGTRARAHIKNRGPVSADAKRPAGRDFPPAPGKSGKRTKSSVRKQTGGKDRTDRTDGTDGADAGVEAKTVELGRRCARFLEPPPKLKISEWADANRILPDYSAEPGQWHTSRTPYLEEPMNACCNPSVSKVVLKFASQVGKSECLLNIAGYYIDCDPAAIMMVQPSKEKAQHFSKQRLAPMLTDTPCLAEKIGPARSRDSSNTILHKSFPGGFIVLVGSNAPGDLASWPIRILLVDEIDRFEPSAGKEGDPLSLAERRMETFWNSKVIICSSPTDKPSPDGTGGSRIHKAYLASTQERWHVPCPSCGTLQLYEWARLLFDTVEMGCEKCGALHNEFEWKAGAGKWIAQAEHSSTRGFDVSGMASPWKRWNKAIDEFKEKKGQGPEVFKTFVNTYWNELWEEKGEAPDEKLLANRRHYYDADAPDGVTFITCGVDVHPDRLEAKVTGWGYGKENWAIEYRMFLGDPHLSGIWDELDEFLQQTYRRSDGEMLPILGTAIDSGYAATEVYKFCRIRGARFIYAVKGMPGPGYPIVNKPRKVGKPGADCWMFPVGSDSTKDLIMTRLHVDEHGPGYCHFPKEDKFSDDRPRGFDDAYYKGLIETEHRVERKVAGNLIYVWRKRTSHARNEPLDCEVYATAALEIRGRGARLEQRRSGEGKGMGQIGQMGPMGPIRKGTGRRGWRVMGKSSG